MYVSWVTVPFEVDATHTYDEFARHRAVGTAQSRLSWTCRKCGYAWQCVLILWIAG
jgi:hypothetical protein